MGRCLPDVAALLKSRGLPVQAIAASRPDILLHAPHTLMVCVYGGCWWHTRAAGACARLHACVRAWWGCCGVAANLQRVTPCTTSSSFSTPVAPRCVRHRPPHHCPHATAPPPRPPQAKIDALPAALGLTPRRARDLIAAWPSALRHSTAALAERYQVGRPCHVCACALVHGRHTPCSTK